MTPKKPKIEEGDIVLYEDTIGQHQTQTLKLVLGRDDKRKCNIIFYGGAIREDLVKKVGITLEKHNAKLQKIRDKLKIIQQCMNFTHFEYPCKTKCKNREFCPLGGGDLMKLLPKTQNG